jgi:hypothetical protein
MALRERIADGFEAAVPLGLLRTACRCCCLPAVLAGAWLASARANTISSTGDLRSDATLLSCGLGCTLGPGDSDSDFAQWAVVVRDFRVSTASTMQAIFSYGGGVNGQGEVIGQGGFERRYSGGRIHRSWQFGGG